MQQRYVAVTNRHICYDSHKEYKQYPEWKNYYDMLHISDSKSREEGATLLLQIEKLCQNDDIRFIVLREKDLSGEDYSELAEAAYSICKSYGMKLVVHYYYKLNIIWDGILLPIGRFREYIDTETVSVASVKTDNEEKYMCNSGRMTGVSVHSVDEAIKVEMAGATFIVAGNIYETDCKKGLPGKGLKYLEEICSAVSIPVYAIGGINDSNIDAVIEAGAEGGCIMSKAMKL